MNRPAKYFVLALVSLLALFVLAACGDTPAPANTPAPTNTTSSEARPTNTRTVRATRTPVAKPTNTRTARATSTPKSTTGGDWKTYSSSEGNWSIDYPSDWTVNEALAPNVQFFAPTNDAFVQVTYADVGARLDPAELVEIASTQLGNSFTGFEETGREEQSDGSTRLDFTFEQQGTAFVGSAFIEQRGTGLYMLMFISEPDATTKYEDTFAEILASYTVPSGDEEPESTPTQGRGSPSTGESLAVGETGDAGDFQITLNSVNRTTDGLLAPGAGNEYLIVDLTVENVGTNDSVVSSLLNFSVKDADGTSYNQSFTAGVETSLDGDVAANQQLTGQIAYEVPQGSTGLVLYFDPILGGNELQWALDE